MKNNYKFPNTKVVDVNTSDIMAQSSYENVKPGHGYGDNNHEHDNDDHKPGHHKIWDDLW